MPVPPFSLETPRFDQNTLEGRVRHFFQVFDPLLLKTTNKELDQAHLLLQKFKKGEIVPSTDEDHSKLWAARLLEEAIMHPQTHQKIPLPFRFSGFVPVNIPIVIGMMATTSVPAQLFWQWFNQSYNVCLNYANGNKTSPLPPKKIATAYVGAVGVSCGLAYGLGEVTKRATRLPPVLASIAKILVPFTAVATAGACNALFMRYNEATDGINVLDEDGEVLGISRLAGRKALTQVALTRIVLPAPILILPGMIMQALSRVPYLKRNPRVSFPLNVAAIAVVLWAALPFAIGLFPQTASAEVSELEPEFHNLHRKNGVPVRTVYFNKGL